MFRNIGKLKTNNTKKFNMRKTGMLYVAINVAIQKVLRQILKNTLFMKFTKLFFNINVQIQNVQYSPLLHRNSLLQVSYHKLFMNFIHTN